MMCPMFGNYKDCQAWRDVGMPLNTASNEACKMYDATMRQMIVRRPDETLGGLEETMTKLFEADPNFVLAHVCKEYMAIMDQPIGDSAVQKSLDNINNLSESQWHQLSDLEKGHCRALQYMGKGQLENATIQFENILTKYPKDYLALQMFYGVQINRAEYEQQKNTVARILPYYNRKTDIEYGYIVGMHAFSLQETHFYDAGEKKAKEALDCDQSDAWASHSLAHIYDMTGRYNEGMDFMLSTQKDWEIVQGIKCHNHWHTALFYIEKGNFEGALNIYDEFVGPSASVGMFQLSDAITMLYRLKMEGIEVGKSRWQDLVSQLDKHYNTHQWSYYDATFLMGFLSADSSEKSQSYLQSVHELAENDDGSDIHHITKSANQYLCDAIYHYDTGDYDKAVDVLLPHRYKIARIGGSDAQRDVFNLMLINAAIKSNNHQKLAIQLINERKYMKETPLTERLQSKLVLLHDKDH